jgi:hypothetical protein
MALDGKLWLYSKSIGRVGIVRDVCLYLVL